MDDVKTPPLHADVVDQSSSCDVNRERNDARIQIPNDTIPDGLKVIHEENKEHVVKEKIIDCQIVGHDGDTVHDSNDLMNASEIKSRPLHKFKDLTIKSNVMEHDGDDNNKIKDSDQGSLTVVDNRHDTVLNEWIVDNSKELTQESNKVEDNGNDMHKIKSSFLESHKVSSNEEDIYYSKDSKLEIHIVEYGVNSSKNLKTESHTVRDNGNIANISEENSTHHFKDSKLERLTVGHDDNDGHKLTYSKLESQTAGHDDNAGNDLTEPKLEILTSEHDDNAGQNLTDSKLESQTVGNKTETIEHDVQYSKDSKRDIKQVIQDGGSPDISKGSNIEKGICQLEYEFKTYENVKKFEMLRIKLCSEWNVHIKSSEKNGVQRIEVTGQEEHVKAVINVFKHAADNEYTATCYTFTADDKEPFDDCSEAFLKQIRTKFNVKIEQKLNLNTRAVILHRMQHPSQVFAFHRGYQSWTFSEGHKLILMKSSLVQCQANVVVDVLPDKPGEEPATQTNMKNACIETAIRIPNWDDGVKAEENRQNLKTCLHRSLTNIDDEFKDSIGLAIDQFTQKEFKNHVTALTNATLEFFRIVSTERGARHVVFCIESEDYFTAALDYIEKCVRKSNLLLQPVYAKAKLKVTVVSGELNKAKADVLVNTTSSSLNLTQGHVSAALLKSAGPDIQEECKRKYPKGINKTEIAITSGYNLPCQRVFHGALDRYNQETEADILMVLRNFIYICLKTATEMKFRSIAFPAIGSGLLEYPVSLVAAEMFSEIEKFEKTIRFTSLEDVYFVVYRENVYVEQEFRKIENAIRTAVITEYRQLVFSPVTEVKLIGNKEHVQKAAAEVMLAPSVADAETMAHVTIPGICWTSYIALSCLYYETIASYRKDGVVFCLTNGCMDMRGKLAIVTAAAVDIQEKVKQIDKMYKTCISLKGRDKEVAKTLSKELSNVHCYLDHIHLLMVIYGKSTRDVANARKLLISKLPVMAVTMRPSVKYKTSKSNKTGGGYTSLPALNTDHCNQDVMNDLSKDADRENRCNAPASLGTERRGAFQLEKGGNKHSSDSNNDLRLLAPFYEIENNENLVGTFTYAQKVIIYSGNILTLEGVVAIVCSEDRSGKANGMVAKKLVTMGKTKYTQEKDKAFQNHPMFGDIVVTGGGALQYRCVIHVIVPHNQPEALQTLIEGIFEEAAKRKLDSIAMSLLGTGAGNYAPSKGAEILYKGYINFCRKHVGTYLTVHIVNNDKRKTASVINVFKEKIEKFDQTNDCSNK